MGKKVVSVILAVCLLFGLCCGVPAEETALASKVEISFALGDRVLMINGEAIESECAPYTVGEGVTLVPVRIITEAFGAEVDWEEATQTVTLTYQDVTIQLVIGSGTALVNGNEVGLLAPPEINQERTMVPLRFISENFGADVGWDGTADRITIVKPSSDSEKPAEGIENILESSDKYFVGDSYFKWSVKRVPDMRLAYRQADGYCTVLASEATQMEMFISIYNINEDNDEITELKRIIKEDTDYQHKDLAEKRLGKYSYAYAQQTTSQFEADIRAYLTDDYIISLITCVPAGLDSDVFREAVEVADTFQLSFTAYNTEDLSEVDEDDSFLFAAEKMGFSIKLPAGWHAVVDPEADNEFSFLFIDDKKALGSGGVSVYSVSAVGGAEAFAAADREGFLAEFNPDYTSCSDVQATEIGGLTAYTYTYRFHYKTGLNSSVKRVFVENGAYVYRIGIQLDNDTFESSRFDEMLNSFTCTPLDSSKLGVLSPSPRSDDNSQLLGNTWGKFQFEIPSYFQLLEEEADASYALDTGSGYTYNFQHKYDMDYCAKRVSLEYGDFRIGAVPDNTADEKVSTRNLSNAAPSPWFGSVGRSVNGMPDDRPKEFGVDIAGILITRHKRLSPFMYEVGSGRDIIASKVPLEVTRPSAKHAASTAISDLVYDSEVISVDSEIKYVTERDIDAVYFSHIQKVEGSRTPYQSTNFIISNEIDSLYIVSVASPVTAADSVNEQKIIEHIIKTFDFE